MLLPEQQLVYAWHAFQTCALPPQCKVAAQELLRQHVICPPHAELDIERRCDLLRRYTVHQVDTESAYHAEIRNVSVNPCEKLWIHTCSPSAHPPHQCIRARVQRSPIGANMNRYCAPPLRKQCVVNKTTFGRPALVAALEIIFCAMSEVMGRCGSMV